MANVKDNHSTHDEIECKIKAFILLVFIAALMIFIGINVAKMTHNVEVTANTSNSDSMVLDLAQEQGSLSLNPLEGRTVELVGYDNMVLKRGEKVFLNNVKENEDFLEASCMIVGKSYPPAS